MKKQFRKLQRELKHIGRLVSYDFANDEGVLNIQAEEEFKAFQQLKQLGYNPYDTVGKFITANIKFNKSN